MLTPNIIRYGSEAELPPQRTLRAGPLTVVYEAGDLRYIRFGEREVVRRIYVAVRDHNWGTILPQMSNEQLEVNDDSFRIAYDMVHQQGEITFMWHGKINGAADGTITCVMDGIAHTAFRSNRTGFCVLHPAAVAGATAQVEHTNGTVENTVFPELIAPQSLEDGQIHPVYPFAEMRAISHEIEAGVWAQLRFEGDVFELEDQRNWIDGSFKTYCRPLRLPFPYAIPASTAVHQAVTLTLTPTGVQQAAVVPTRRTTFSVTRAPLGPLPQIGLGATSHQQPLRLREIERLRALHLAHLRVDLRLSEADWLQRLQQAHAAAQAIGSHLEIALFLTDQAEREVAQLRMGVDALRPEVARWLVFHQGEQTTAATWLHHARASLTDYAPDAPFAGGTNAYFTDLNRGRPDTEVLDLVAYSVNPQVHAFDNASLVETAPTFAATVASARAFSGGKPVIVSPVTLKPRFNPAATGPELEPTLHTLPPQVDVRQMSLLGACWTLTSLKYLAESGAASVTYYETTGWRGVMETEAGSPLPEQFRSLPGAVFPLYHVLADVGEWPGANVLAAHTSDPLTVDGIAIERQGAIRVLLANLTNLSQTIQVQGLSPSVQMRVLDETTAVAAMHTPETFRAAIGPEQITSGTLELVLAPYAVTTIESV